MTNGKIIYGGTTYTFGKNFDFDFEAGYVGQDSRERGSGGGLVETTRTNKKKFRLPFTGVSSTQKAAFIAAYASNASIDLYLDGTVKDATVMFSEPPAFTSTPNIATEVGGWDCELVFEEI